MHHEDGTGILLQGPTTSAHGSRVPINPYEIGAGGLTEMPPQRGSLRHPMCTNIMWIEGERCHAFYLTRECVWSTDTLSKIP